MLSIMVNDALIGIDVMKKYPALYARMLADKQSRTAFLDTLELLEQSRAGELPEYSGPSITNLDFLRQATSKPIIRKTSENKLELVWHRTTSQLQKIFPLVAFHPGEDYRSNDLFLDESPLNLLHSRLEIDEQEFEVRLTAIPAAANPENLNLLLSVFAPEGISYQFEAGIIWGDYRHTVEVTEFGLADFPPLRTTQLFAPSGNLNHDLELHLKQVD
jgi:hypothetical protein